METIEHWALGNALILNHRTNPYIKIDEQGCYRINMQTLSPSNMPEAVKDLWLSPGEIICAAGDYFTDKDWDMKLILPSCESFNNIEHLRKFLIDLPPYPSEKKALLQAYLNLASDHVSNDDIDTILKINRRNYLPFSQTLNDYMRTLVLYFSVENMGEMLLLNQTHFTPWAVRVYVLGHHLALQYGRCAWFLHQLADNPAFEPNDALCKQLLQDMHAAESRPSPESLREQAHRFHALSLGLELFTLHYYSDHFAAGHMSQVGDLRTMLPKRFGVWGSILANNIHNELNYLGVLTHKPFDPNPDAKAIPIPASGDGSFDAKDNACNKNACRQGMQASLRDIETAVYEGTVPNPSDFKGLEHLPDVGYQFRQMQPLLLIHNDVVYQRRNLRRVEVLAPSDYQAMLANPQAHGYSAVRTKWQACLLVAKLRLFPFIYKGKVQDISLQYLNKIRSEEPSIGDHQPPIPSPPYSQHRASNSPPPSAETSTLPARVSQQGIFAPLAKQSSIEIQERSKPHLSL